MSTPPSAGPARGRDTSSSESGAGLSRSIGLLMFVAYGVSTIVGAGIFVLVGEVSGQAGLATPVVFLLAGLIAGVTALSYAELGARHPEAGGPAAFTDRAFHWPALNVVVGYGIAASGLVSAGTIASGFAGYLSIFVSMPAWAAKGGVLVALGFVAAVGARETTWVMLLSVLAGLVGLGAVIQGGLSQGGPPAQTFAEMLRAVPDFGALPLLSSVFLAFYAFIGFEDMVHMAEEVKDPARNIPRGLIVSLVATVVLYAATAFAALNLVGAQELAQAEAPLVYASERAGFSKWLVGIASLLILPTGALAQIVMASRMLFDLGRRGAAPTWLARVHGKTHTPLAATALVTLTAVVLTLGFPLRSLASMTSFILLGVFAISNVALIVLKRREVDAPFRVPRWVPYLGAALCMALLAASMFDVGSGAAGH